MDSRAKHCAGESDRPVLCKVKRARSAWDPTAAVRRAEGPFLCKFAIFCEDATFWFRDYYVEEGERAAADG